MLASSLSTHMLMGHSKNILPQAAHLGCHHVECAGPGDRSLLPVIDRQPKIGQLDCAVSCQQYIFRLDVSMDDTLQNLMGHRATLRDAYNELQCAL